MRRKMEVSKYGIPTSKYPLNILFIEAHEFMLTWYDPEMDELHSRLRIFIERFACVFSLSLNSLSLYELYMSAWANSNIW